MPRGRINKSAKIRQALGALGPDALPREVIAELAKRRIRVTPSQVSNIKGKLARPAATTSDQEKEVSISALWTAHKFVQQIGSLQQAQTALAMLAKLC